MPIKQLQTNKPGLPRAGIIRLGVKVDTGKLDKNKQPILRPVETPHFVLTDAPDVATALGNDKPTELSIYFPFDEIDLVFPAYMHHFTAGALVCRGDGEHIIYAIDPQTGKATVKDGKCVADFQESSFENKRISHKPGDDMFCPGPNRNLYAKCAFCKPNGMLLVLLRDVPRLAYYQIATGSIHNIVEITEQLTNIRQIIGNLTGTPRLTGVPFVLKRVKRKISTPRPDGPRQRVDKYFLQLEIDPEWVLKMAMAQRQLVDPTRNQAALPAGTEAALTEATPTAAGYSDPPVWEIYEDEEDDDDEQKSFATVDDLLFAISQKTGKNETDARALLKRAWHNGFTVSKSGLMYEAAIKQFEVETETQPAETAYTEPDTNPF